MHQVPEPLRRAGTSDRHFYDRFYFNLHPCSLGGLMMAIGYANYPNLGVVDAFAVVNADGHHRVLRASRALGADRAETSVGPIHIKVLEGLRRHRIVIEPNPWGIALDAVLNAAFPAQLEPRDFARQLERVTTDVCRFTQTGRWEGTLSVGGRTYDLSPEEWWGERDRSWGVRPVGDPEPAGRLGSLPVAGAMTQWAPMQFEDFELLYFVKEDGAGRRTLEEAVRVWPEASGRSPEQLGPPIHELEFHPGTRTARSGVIRFPKAPEGELTVTFQTSTVLRLGVGTGYAGDDEWRHGKWQGPLAVDGIDLDLEVPEHQVRMVGTADALSRFECDGHVGWGVFEHTIRGPNTRYGFT